MNTNAKPAPVPAKGATQSDQLFQALQTLKLQYPSILFPSEYDYPVQIVKLGWWQLFGRKREADGYEQMLLESAIDTAESSIEDLSSGELSKDKTRTINGYKGLKILCETMLKQHRLVSIKRKTKKAGEYELLVLAYFGWNYIGFKTTLVETA